MYSDKNKKQTLSFYSQDNNENGRTKLKINYVNKQENIQLFILQSKSREVKNYKNVSGASNSIFIRIIFLIHWSFADFGEGSKTKNIPPLFYICISKSLITTQKYLQFELNRKEYSIHNYSISE